MIHVDESDPVGELEVSFPSRNVVIKRGIDANDAYEMVNEIGRGKFGTVYRCREKSSGLQLAAKFVPIPKREDRRNVEREVELMNSLQHSLIIQLYDALEYQKMMCVVLELVEGGELFDRVIDDDFVLTERACAVVVRQLCQAMEFVHRNNIIHLDLKPENILCLTREGNRIKIIDFGLARKFDPDKKLQVLFGTPEFVAPEVVNFDQISFGTDMWSVGVICYVLLSGLSPFMGGTDIETMANVTIGKYDFDDEAFNAISKEALDFIGKLLVKDSSARLTAAQCLTHKWLKRRVTTKTKGSKCKTSADGHQTPARRKGSNSSTTSTASNGSTIDAAFAVPEVALSVDTVVKSGTDDAVADVVAANVPDTSAAEAPLTNGDRSANGAPDDALLPEDHIIGAIEDITASGDNGHSNAIISTDSDNNVVRNGHLDCNGNDANGNRTSASDDVFNGAETRPPQSNGNSADATAIDDGAELRTTKDNLKSFIERWEEHSNCPYVFDTGSNCITRSQAAVDGLLANGDEGGSAVLRATATTSGSSAGSLPSSRVASPSPCDMQGSDPIQNSLEDNHLPPASSTTLSSRWPIATASDRSAPPNTDTIANSNCSSASDKDAHRVNLAHEIKRLSERLMLLSSLSVESNETHADSPPNVPSAINTKPTLKPKPEFLKHKTRTSMDEYFAEQLARETESATARRAFIRNASQTSTSSSTQSSTYVQRSTTTFQRASSVVNTRCTSSTSTVLEQSSLRNDRLSARLALLDELPTINRSLRSETVDQSTTHTLTFASDIERPFSRPLRETPASIGRTEFAARRTKFRVSQNSRDVPIDRPDTHRPIFLEDAVSTTKDCLLHLLDKYTDGDRLASTGQRLRPLAAEHRAASLFGQQREQSLDRFDESAAEQRSSNSLNYFFQRHAVAGKTVRQMQAQLESKRHW